MSEKINWTDATEMIEAYQNNSRVLLANPPSGCEIIRGYKFDKSDIQDVLNHANTDTVVVMPAVNKNDLSKPETEQTFTMIIAGLDRSGNIVTAIATDYAPSFPVDFTTPTNYPNVPTC